MKSLHVLVLGGTGFVGRNLVRHLLTDGGFRVQAPKRAELDVTDFAAAETLLRAIKPDIVVNCAASTGIGAIEGQSAVEQLNIHMPARWAELCARAGCRFVHLSTDQIFPGTQAVPYRETDAGGAVSTYGITKFWGEQAVLAHARHLVARTSFVFGADGNTFMSRLPRLLAGNQPLKVVTGIRASCTHVSRLCEYLGKLMRAEAQGVFHVANRGEVSWEAFAARCRAEMLAQGIAVRCPEMAHVTYDSMRAALGPRALYSALDVSKLESGLGACVPEWPEEIPIFVQHCFAPARRVA